MTTTPGFRSDHRRWMAVAVLAVLGWVVAPPLDALAQDQSPLDLSIRSAEVLESGETRLVVDVEGVPAGDLDPAALTITEDGEPVEGVTATLASEIAEPEPRSVMVALDTSGSTEGEPLANALAAVEGFAQTVTERGVAVGLVPFSNTATVEVGPTTDPAPVAAALQGLEADGETALYDAVVEAARSLGELEGQRTIVVFSDGADTVSTADLSGALSAASFVGADVSSVALVTEAFDPAALESLADATSGRVVQVSAADQLQAAFQEVAQELSSQYVLTYPSTGRTGQFPIEVVLATGGRQASDSLPILNTVVGDIDVSPNVTVVPEAGTLGTRTVFLGALAALGIGLAVLALAILLPGSDRRVARSMQTAFQSTRSDGEREELTPATAAISRRAVKLIEAVPKPEGYDQRMQQELDRASWPVRSSEFTTLRALAVLIGLGLGWGVLGSLVFGAVFAVLGWFGPRLMLSQRVNSRQKAFMEQLPDTLQLLAGSLKAGYGVLQAIDTVVKETPDPTKSEFQRVLSEARLGLPLEDSLDDMASRIGTEDFRWVSVAINIQRRVGGNLAALLETVAATLRERAATRRQIQALSAEGRLSAVILVGLPIVLTLYMFLVQPEYIGELFTHWMGQIILAVVTVLMVVGVFWMKNMIDIDV